MSEPITTYLLQNKKELKDDKEVYQFLQKSFPELQANSICDSYFSFVLSALAHICYPLSLMELKTVLGKDFLHRQKIKNLTDRGILKSYKMPILDRGARNAYYLSTSGSDALFNSLPLGVFEKQKIRRTEGRLPAHEYGVGLSLLQCLLRETPFSFQKEVPYPSTLHKKKGDLCVDAEVQFLDSHRTLLYLEQDMGTERPYIIADKLKHYNAYGLLSNANHHLVISSHSLFHNTCPSFNASALEELAMDMERRGANWLYAYYKSFEGELPVRLRTCLRALLVRTGICSCYNRAWAPKDASALLDGDELVRRLGKEDFSLKEVKTYVNTLKEGTNQYKEMAYHAHQLSTTYDKLKKMANYIYRLIKNGHTDRGEAQLLLNGQSCYVLPSVLLSNYFDTITGEHIESVRHTLSCYFPEITTADFTPLSNMISLEGYHPLFLRNCYQLTDGSIVCVEFPGIDLGGYVRVLYLKALKKMGLETNIHVVCVYDTYEEAKELAASLEYCPKHRIVTTQDITYSFLLSHNIGDLEALLMFSKLGGGSLLPVSLPQPKSVKPTASPSTLTKQFENMSMEELLNMM